MYASFRTNPAKVFHCLRWTYIRVHLAYRIYDQLGKLLVERLIHFPVLCAHLSVTIPCPVGSLLPRFSDIVRWGRRMYSTVQQHQIARLNGGLLSIVAARPSLRSGWKSYRRLGTSNDRDNVMKG